MLPLLHHHFTGYYTCSVLILLDIAACSRSILPDVAFAAPPFTGYYTCSVLILLDIVLAADQFYQMLPLLHTILLDITLAVY